MNTVDSVVEAAEEVHDILGVGHTESTYHRAMERELSERGVDFGSEGTIPIYYKDTPVGRRRPDMFVDGGSIVVELKAGSHAGKEQLLGYRSILEHDDNFDIDHGLLIRFNDELEIVRS